MNDMVMALAVLIVFFALLFFILIKPQMDSLKAHKGFVESLKIGDRVVTAGGIVGTIIDFPDQEHVNLEIAKGLIVRVLRDLIYEADPA